MDMLNQEADSYQSFIDRGKQAMDNYDLQKITHDGLDEAYKSGKNLASEFAREALGERTIGYIESGIGAAPMVGKAFNAVSSQVKASQASNAYTNMTGKSLKQGLQERQMQSRFKERQARQQKQRESRQQEKPEEEPKQEQPKEPTKEDPEELRTATEDDADLQARLDRLREDPPEEESPISGESESASYDVDEYGLPRVQGVDAPVADDAPAATEAGFPKPPEPASEPAAEASLDDQPVLQRADDVFQRMDEVLRTRGGAPYAQRAQRLDAPDEVPTEVEALQGRGGDVGFGQGAAAPDRGGTYSTRGGVRELDRASLRQQRMNQPEFDEDFGQTPRQVARPGDSVSQYGDRPTEGGMEQAQAEREARFAQMDQDAAEQAARDAADRAQPPTRGREFGDDIGEGPTEIPGRLTQQQEFDDDYLPEDEETRLARIRESRAPLEDQGLENPIGPRPGESQAPTDERLGTFTEEAQKSGVEPDASLPKPQPQPESSAPKVDPAPEETADLGIGAEEDAALTEGLATAEAAESALPGLGEGLMALTAIGGIIYSALDKPEKSSTPAPVALPPPPVQGDTAFASAPLIDSNQFHSL